MRDKLKNLYSLLSDEFVAKPAKKAIRFNKSLLSRLIRRKYHEFVDLHPGYISFEPHADTQYICRICGEEAWAPWFPSKKQMRWCKGVNDGK